MNLQQIIKRVLKEQKKFSPYFSRRFRHLDEVVESIIEDMPPECYFFSTFYYFLRQVKSDAIERMFHAYLYQIDDGSKEWEELYIFMESYIEEKYGERLYKIYKDCVEYRKKHEDEKTLKEELTIPLNFKRRLGFIEDNVNWHLKNDLQNDNQFLIHNLGSEKYIKYIIDDTVYKVWNHFDIYDDIYDIDYDEFYQFLKEYVENNFGDKIRESYYENTIIKRKKNKNIKEQTDEEEGIILYRGVSPKEAKLSCEEGHLVYYSKDPMSRDWEVIEYGLGDSASEMSDEEIDEYINDLVPWTPNDKGVNLTSDLENAMGYSDIVLEINLIGDYTEFSDVHYFAKDPEDCIVKSVYYKGKHLSKQQFLHFFENN